MQQTLELINAERAGCALPRCALRSAGGRATVLGARRWRGRVQHANAVVRRRVCLPIGIAAQPKRHGSASPAVFDRGEQLNSNSCLSVGLDGCCAWPEVGAEASGVLSQCGVVRVRSLPLLDSQLTSVHFL